MKQTATNKLNTKTIGDLQQIAVKFASAWQTELSRLDKCIGELNYAAGLLQYAEGDELKSYARDHATMSLSGIIIHAVFLANEFGIDIESELPEDLLDLILEHNDISDTDALKLIGQEPQDHE